MTRVRVLLLLVASAWLAGCGQADGVDVTNTQQGVLPATEGSKDFGDYVVFFNALNTDQLKPEIAREYEIVRSKSRAMLSVAWPASINFRRSAVELGSFFFEPLQLDL